MKKLILILLLAHLKWAIGQTPNANELVAIHAATTAEISAIVSPIEGSLIYNTDDKFLYQYTGSSWQKLTPEGSDTKIIPGGNIGVSGSGTTADPYVISSIKPTFTTGSNGSFTFSNGTDPDVTFSPSIPGNTPIVSNTNAGGGNCLQFALNETRDIEINGNYYDGGSTVTITGQTVNSVTVVSPNQLIVSVTSGNTYGNYDITVTNNSGVGTLTAGFILQPPVPINSYGITQAEMTITGTTTYDGTTLSKESTGANGWNAQGYSTDHIINPNSGGRLDFTASQTNKLLMVGLSDNPSQNGSYTSLDFAMYLVTNSQIQIRESGASKGYKSSYATGDVLSINVDCIGTVTYLRNGTVFYTSTLKALNPLYFDTSLYHPDAMVSNISMNY